MVADCNIMRCAWCHSDIQATARRDSRYCSKRCRQTAFRLRRLKVVGPGRNDGSPLRLAYADPPYPGLARKYYGHESTYAGEVDHAALIASLRTSYDGWALSTSAKALGDILPLCPPDARVCAWTKPIGAAPATFGPHNCWEPLIVVPGRRRRPGVRDWLSAQPARGGGSLPGRKPIAFCAWMFELLGATPGLDEFDDLFPGTGIVGRCWRELSSACRGDTSRLEDATLSGSTPLDTCKHLGVCGIAEE